jgi:NAD-dependent DNA ligase
MSNIKTTTSKAKVSKPKTNFDPNIIVQVNADPYSFVSTTDADTLVSVISYAADKYYNDIAVISDETYDFLIDTIKEIDPNHPVLKQVGAKVMSKNKVKLPYYMGSMDKVKPSDQAVLNKWLSKYKGPYVYSDKLDGVSGLLVMENSKFKLFTRGDGYEGTDITNLIPYMPTISKLKLQNLTKLKNLAVRGELIMSIQKFTAYADRMANARNMVSGIVNSKTIDTDIVPDVDFVAYEIISPWIQSQSEQFNILKSLGFKVVPNSTIDIQTDLEFSNLSTILSQRKKHSEYEIDGIIISNDQLPPKRKADSNPDYAFAFKDPSLLATANVKVLGVEWAVSKDGYIKPTLKLVPTSLGGVTISSVTAIHAKYVLENVLGPGAVIELIRSGDVIPKIQKVLKQADSGEAQFPDIEYEWTSTNVDIITTGDSAEQLEKELTFFFKKLSISNVDESTVKKMINVGINSIGQILTITKEELAQIEGFKERMVEKVYQNIMTRVQNLTMLDLMTASNVFGHGMGERKLRKVMETYPDIIKLYTEDSRQDIIDKIKQLDGFDIKTAEYFANGLDKFIDLFNTLEPNMRKQLRISIIKFKDELEQKEDLISNSTNKFAGKIIVLSGFRDKGWQTIIESNGGKVNSSVSNKTNLLVTKAEDIKGTNAKVVTARKLNIPIMSKEDFESEYIK